MPAESPRIRKTESIFDTIEKMNDRISRRAYEIFEDSGRIFGNWLAAEREIFSPP